MQRHKLSRLGNENNRIAANQGPQSEISDHSNDGDSVTSSTGSHADDQSLSPPEDEPTLLKNILRCCLNPRGQKKEYEKYMKEIFAHLSFLEGSYGTNAVKEPFSAKDGRNISANSKSSEVQGLSVEAKTFMNGKCVSDFLFPTEEVFFCLTIAKYVLALLEKLAKKDSQVDLSDFYSDHERKLFPVTPFKKSHNACYGQEDLNFYNRYVTIVQQIYVNDKRVSATLAKSQKTNAAPCQDTRWLVFDYGEEISDSSLPTTLFGGNSVSSFDNDNGTNESQATPVCSDIQAIDFSFV